MALDVLTIGTATRDVFLASTNFKVVRDPSHLKKLGFVNGEAECFAFGGKLEVGKPTLAIGGGAANAATTFARQGLRAAAAVRVGSDENGEAVLKGFKREKITPFVANDRAKGTGYSVILISPNGERTVLTYRGASEDLRARDVPLVRTKFRAAYIVPGEIKLSEMEAIVRALKKSKVFIAMNPSRHYLDLGAKRLAPILSRLDVISVNREEAADLTGEQYENESRIFKKLEAMIAGIAVMTDGPRGVLVSNGNAVYSAGVYPNKKVVDRTGAGDAFGSGFVAGLLRHRALTKHPSDEAMRYAIRLGSANGTSVVERMGAEEGILTRAAFERSRRWQGFKISKRELR